MIDGVKEILAKTSKGFRRLLIENIKIVERNTFGSEEVFTMELGSYTITPNDLTLLRMARSGRSHRVKATIYSPEDL